MMMYIELHNARMRYIANLPDVEPVSSCDEQEGAYENLPDLEPVSSCDQQDEAYEIVD